MADFSRTHRLVRDRLLGALSVIFAVYMGYLAHSDGVALGPSIFYGLLAFVIVGIALLVLRGLIYPVILAALVIWLFAHYGYGWAEDIVSYVSQLCHVAYVESLKLFKSADATIRA
ncbi:hypothetical protein [Martelella sp. HB161492]|uniref:hypothetical protein n=1 Tax=Martelella sp. HB161492 TaxID=2720726 RepID=UPI0015911732|nr:hypothetical protein [Martelella sp. HB161492]